MREAERKELLLGSMIYYEPVNHPGLGLLHSLSHSIFPTALSDRYIHVRFPDEETEA